MPVNRSSSKISPIGEKRVTTFTAQQQDNGMKLMIAGWMQMHPARNMPNYVRGTIRLDEENVPIVDLQAKTGKTPKRITENACVVLYERKSGKKTVTTGAIYEDVTDLLKSMRGKLISPVSSQSA